MFLIFCRNFLILKGISSVLPELLGLNLVLRFIIIYQNVRLNYHHVTPFYGQLYSYSQSDDCLWTRRNGGMVLNWAPPPTIRIVGTEEWLVTPFLWTVWMEEWALTIPKMLFVKKFFVNECAHSLLINMNFYDKNTY